MEKKMEQIKQELFSLQQRIKELEQENQLLKELLERNNIPLPQRNQSVKPETITRVHVLFFYRMFKGRKDVFSRRSVNRDGKAGYYPVCDNFWKYGLCPKRDRKKVRCRDCANQQYTPLRQKDLIAHLTGEKENCSDVVGIYPMLADETCNFLVFDFDHHGKDDAADPADEPDWREEVNALRRICAQNEIPALVERSRSGHGAHVWLFFEESIPAAAARRFGAALLTKGAELVNQADFRSYDRMLPAQDHLPEGGLGNLIALPLQGRALQQGNSAFIDENWAAYPDQWSVLRQVKKLSRELIEEKTKEWSKHGGVLGPLVSEPSQEQAGTGSVNETEPWKKQQWTFYREDASDALHLVYANRVYVRKENLKPRLQNQIRRLAAFNNPDFYKKQAMGFQVTGISRIIYCAYDTEEYICLPRGCLSKLLVEAGRAGIALTIDDQRQRGETIDVAFQGDLYPEQQTAALRMLEHDNGILAAATAFGKTAVGAYLIAQRKVNTLILVHNREIMKNWVEDLLKFLEIREEPPTYATATGRVKKRKSVIGTLYAGHDSMTGIIDVAMIGSLGKKGETDQRVKGYGMVLMDECHHSGAQTAANVIAESTARFVYGLTATPKRDDGREQQVYFQFGPVRYRFTARDKAALQGVDHFVYPRFTRLVNVSDHDWKLQEAYRALVSSDVRNQQIVRDAIQCIENGRTPLILTKFKEHAAILVGMLEEHVQNLFLLQGGRSTKERDQIREKLRSVPGSEAVAIVATGQYIGEGFNFPRLDTLLLTTPVSWEGVVEQYVGRLHRDYSGKRNTAIYDYVDSHIRVLETMYRKRMRTYKKIGYEICSGTVGTRPEEAGSVFDGTTYLTSYEQDLCSCQREILICSPGVNRAKVRRLLQRTQLQQEQGVQVIVWTLSPEQYPKNRIERTEKLLVELREGGVAVRTFQRLHEHFAVLDRELVWYGSVNLLSREKEEDSLLRIASREIAEELLVRGADVIKP